MAGFGGAVKLTGESEYRKAIQQITQDLSKMSGALKTQAADFNANNSSMSNSAQKQKELNDALKAQQDGLAKAKSAYAQYTVAVQTQTTRHNALTKEYQAAVLELDRIGKECGETSEEYQNQAKVVDKLGSELAQSTEELNESKSAMSSLKSEINNASRTIDSTTKAIDDLGNETEDSGKKAKGASEGYTVFKNILANLGTQAINSAINGLKKLGGAFINTGKQAIDSYASYEQLEGGVKKIFGDEMAQEVMANAQKAFQTAGMSANEYMENVTSFSATLLQGLGDDTSKAANYADEAMRQMSDNANTFGTDISSIQNAYQGFAKGNFTMLDNLKLGYGGTQAEMARLINESGVLGDAMEVTAETVKDVPFHQMIEAIGVTQERMGIMGTTAKEAAGTIEGSTGSMKAAWQNMLTGMVDENANFEQLATNFVGTLITEDGTGGVIGTLVPRISQVITGMSNAIQTMLPMLIQQVVPLIQGNLPVIIEAVNGAMEAILVVLPKIIPVIADLIPQIVSSLIALLPQMVVAGIEILLGLVQGITEAIPQLMELIPEIISDLVEIIIDWLPDIIDAGVNILLALVNGLISAMPQIVLTGIELLTGLIQGLSEAIPQLVDYIPEIVETIVTVLIDNLPLIIDSAVQMIVALINGLIQSLPKLVAMAPKIIITIVSTLIKNLPQIIQGGVQIIASLIEGIGKSLGNLLIKAKEIGKTVLDAVKEIPSKMLDVGKNLVKGIWEGISNSFNWIKNKIKGWVGNVTDFIKKLFGINSPSKLFRDEIGTNLALGIGEGFSGEMAHVSKEMADSIPKTFDVAASVTGSTASNMNNPSYWGMVDAFKEALSQMKIELDDDEVGRFIDKTVTRMVYS